MSYYGHLLLSGKVLTSAGAYLDDSLANFSFVRHNDPPGDALNLGFGVRNEHA